jgi:GT2 family glycosyltransferase
MEQPLISIISVHYNQLELTRAFLESLRLLTYKNIEIIVIDNGSTKEPVKPLIKDFPEAQFIVNQENLGFAGGNNLGIKVAKGDYLLFLNNDTEPAPDFIEPLLKVFRENELVGMASPKIIYHGTNKIQFVGSGSINPYTGRSFREYFKEEDNNDFNFSKPTEMLHGAALMVRREVIEKIGLMPEVYFLYYEEVDWCSSAKKLGYELWIVASSVVYHKESMSIGKNSPFKTYYMTRGRILYLRRNTEGLKKLSWIVFYIALTIPKNLLNYLLMRDFKNLKSFIRGVRWNLTNKTSVN